MQSMKNFSYFMKNIYIIQLYIYIELCIIYINIYILWIQNMYNSKNFYNYIYNNKFIKVKTKNIYIYFI